MVKTLSASLSSSVKPASTRKKLIDALLLVPIIVPTAATITSTACVYLFLRGLRCSRFNPRERIRCSHGIGGYAGPGVILDISDKK